MNIPMHLFGLHFVDYILICAYLLGMLYIGYRLSRKNADETDFYLAGRKLGKVQQFFLMFGGATDANGAVSIAAEVFRQGVGGVWLGLQMMFSTPFYWFYQVWFRRVRLISMADLFEDRFGNKKLAALFAVYAIILASCLVGFGYFAAGKTMQAVLLKDPINYTIEEQRMVAEFSEFRELQALISEQSASAGQMERFQVLENRHTTGELRGYVSYLSDSPLTFYILYGAIVAFYVIFGGFRAAVLTNVVQGVLIIVFSFILIPYGIIRLGGFSGLHQSVPAHMFSLFGTSGLSEYTWYSITAMVLVTTVSVVGGFGNMAGGGSARNEYDARIGVVTGAFAKRFMIMAWAIAGLIAYGLFRDQIADPDQTWGFLSQNLLGPGLIGLMMAGILAANMSSMDASSICISALFVRNLYTPIFPNRSEQHYVFVGRILIFVVLTTGLFIGMHATGLVSFIRMLLILPLAFGSVVVLIFLWRKLTVAAIYVEVVSFLLIFAIVPVIVGGSMQMRAHPSLTVVGEPRIERVDRGVRSGDRADEQQGAVVMDLAPEVVEQPPRALFFDSVAWVNVDDPSEGTIGVGRFNVEVYMASLVGMPVERFSAAGLMATRFFVSFIFPFAILLIVSPFTKKPDKECLDRFFVRMKTPVNEDLEKDALAVEASYRNPYQFDHLKLFPKSSWEFCKWNQQDTVGFVLCWIAAFAVIGLFLWVLKIGA